MVKRSQSQGFGPQPSAANPHLVRNLSKARAKILELLSLGTCTVSSLAMHTGQHENTIREHLDALVEEALAIKFHDAEHVRGRPAWRYRRSNEADDARFGEYAGLAAALAGTLARTSADPRRHAIEAGKAWGHELLRNVDSTRPEDDTETTKTKPSAIRSKVVVLLKQLGFAPTPNVALTKIKLTRCPLLDAARQHPEIICNVHLGILQQSLSEFGAVESSITSLELIPFAERGSCTLRL